MITHTHTLMTQGWVEVEWTSALMKEGLKSGMHKVPVWSKVSKRLMHRSIAAVQEAYPLLHQRDALFWLHE